MFGGKQIEDFSRHPNVRAKFKETTGKENVTTAAGKYQFLNSTWGGLQKKLGLNDFTPSSQDVAAVELLKESGALGDILNGNFGSAIQKTGKIWASLPSSTYNQGKRSWQWAAEKIGLRNGGPKPKQETPDMPDMNYMAPNPMGDSINISEMPKPQDKNFFADIEKMTMPQEQYAPMQIRYALSNMWDDAEVDNG